jgi:hypothetical protein
MEMFARRFMAWPAYQLGLEKFRPSDAAGFAELRRCFLKPFHSSVNLVFTQPPPDWARLLEAWGVARLFMPRGGGLAVPSDTFGSCNYVVLPESDRDAWRNFSGLPDFGVLWVGGDLSRAGELASIPLSRAHLAKDGWSVFTDDGPARFEPLVPWDKLPDERGGLRLLECLLSASRARRPGVALDRQFGLSPQAAAQGAAGRPG